MMITFSYVDPELLRLHSDSSVLNATAGVESGKAKNRREVDEQYEAISNVAAEEEGGKEKESKEVVLQFSFNDGEIKSANGVGKVIGRKFA